MEETLTDIVMESVETASDAVKGRGNFRFLIGSYTANLYLEKLDKYYKLPADAKIRRKHHLKNIHQYLLDMSSPLSLQENSLAAKLAKAFEFVINEDLEDKINLYKKAPFGR